MDIILLAQQTQDVGNPIMEGALSGAIFGGVIGAIVGAAVWGIKRLTAKKPSP